MSPSAEEVGLEDKWLRPLSGHAPDPPLILLHLGLGTAWIHLGAGSQSKSAPQGPAAACTRGHAKQGWKITDSMDISLVDTDT